MAVRRPQHPQLRGGLWLGGEHGFGQGLSFRRQASQQGASKPAGGHFSGTRAQNHVATENAPASFSAKQAASPASWRGLTRLVAPKPHGPSTGPLCSMPLDCGGYAPPLHDGHVRNAVMERMIQLQGLGHSFQPLSSLSTGS